MCVTGAAIVFFTYIGFDSVSTAAEECNRPQRDLPFGILMTLLVCTLLYVSVSLVLTGVANWKTLSNAAPVVTVLKDLGYENVRRIVGAGALLGMLSSLLVFQYGQARVWFAMSRDGLLPEHLLARACPIQDSSRQHLGRGTGSRYSCRHLGYRHVRRSFEYRDAVRVYRRLGGRDCLAPQPARRPRGFRVPLVPFVPALSIVFCLLLMLGLPLETWIRFFVWLIIGLTIYFTFGRRASRLSD